MTDPTSRKCVAFRDSKRVASGSVVDVALQLRALGCSNPGEALVFDARTSAPIDLDLSGTDEEVRARFAPGGEGGKDGETGEKVRSRGRPRLGVVSREITLLPRQWAWLNEQHGGASPTLRKLVDRARRENLAADGVRRSQNAAYGFMSAMAGNETGFEEATRALFRGDGASFRALIAGWPDDVRAHVDDLAGPALEG